MRLHMMGAFVLLAPMAFAQQITVKVDGNEVDFPGMGPQMMGGRVMVPVRGVFEHMGALVTWHAATREVKARDANTDITLKIGSTSALVNGNPVSLDVPARVVNGRTIVPLRFLSENLGANVQWVEADRLVLITTGQGANTVVTRNQVTTRKFATIDAGTVLPVRLDQELSSTNSRRGDTFTASLRQDETETYAGLPWGTKVEGRVVTARPRNGNNPGVLELDFTYLRLPDGSRKAIAGSLISLDSSSVVRRDDGTIVVRPDKREDRLIYAGVGAAGGLIVGLITKKPLEGTILGGILGYLYGENKLRNQEANNVVLKPGTEFGVRLDQDVRVRVS